MRDQERLRTSSTPKPKSLTRAPHRSFQSLTIIFTLSVVAQAQPVDAADHRDAPLAVVLCVLEQAWADQRIRHFPFVSIPAGSASNR